MEKTQVKLTIETFLTVLDNYNIHIDNTLLFNKNVIEGFIQDLQDDLTMLVEDFGKEDETVLKYQRVIAELKEYIKLL